MDKGEFINRILGSFPKEYEGLANVLGDILNECWETALSSMSDPNFEKDSFDGFVSKWVHSGEGRSSLSFAVDCGKITYFGEGNLDDITKAITEILVSSKYGESLLNILNNAIGAYIKRSGLEKKNPVSFPVPRNKYTS